MKCRQTPLALLCAAVLVFGGCQAIFTYSPLTGLQTPPSSMTPAQRLTYAQDALASGDQSAMLKAYDAIKNDTGAQSQYITASNQQTLTTGSVGSVNSNFSQAA